MNRREYLKSSAIPAVGFALTALAAEKALANEERQVN